MTTITPRRPDLRPGRDGFWQLLHAEWTKFRTVRGWVAGMIVAALLTVGVALLDHSECGTVTPQGGQVTGCPAAPLGPGGEAVTDSFYFVGQPLVGNGVITVRVTSLTGLYSPNGGIGVGANGALAGMKPGVQPWTKAGIIIKANLSQGSAYAAMMITGGNGVRMQYDYTGDAPGIAGNVTASSPRWLRLSRSGDTVTGYDSSDAAHWTRVGTVTLALPPAVRGGLFAASPGHVVTSQSLGGGSATGGETIATAAFDQVSLSWPAGAWTGGPTGARGPAVGTAAGPGQSFGSFRQQPGGAITVTGSGDIAPDTAAGGDRGGRSISRTLVGTFAGLIAMIVIGAMFFTAEYRRGLIRVTLTASPRRGRVLAAKALVIGAIAFVAGLIASAVAIPVGERVLRSGGNQILPVTGLTEFRVIAGNGAMLAVATVLALGLGAMLRRGAAAVTAVIVVIFLPYLLSTVPGLLPVGIQEWLLRITPAAAFAVQQPYPAYHQVLADYTPVNGYYPLAPWAGFAVLCAWAAVALAGAAVLLRRRDA
jgi:ABC-type transport system involved in multi-copper enzyme maturation permease subunit